MVSMVFETKLYTRGSGGGWSRLYVSQELRQFTFHRVTPEPLRRLFGVFFIEPLMSATNRAKLVNSRGGTLSYNYFHMEAPTTDSDDNLVPVISYLATQDQSGTLEHYTSKSRQSLKPGRWVKALFNEKTLLEYGVTDGVLEEFTNAMKRHFNESKWKYKEVVGEDIWRYYQSNASDVLGGTLNSSCMRDASKSALQLYTDSMNTSMLTVFNSADKVVGRALIWRNVEADIRYYNASGNLSSPETRTITFLDRQYVRHDELYKAMQDYAKQRGWFYRDYGGALHDPKGESVYLEMSVDTGMARMPDASPYIDTFRYVWKIRPSYQRRTLWVATMEARDGMVRTDIDGWVLKDSVTTCRDCNRTGSSDNQYKYIGGKVLYLCNECLKAKYTYSSLESTYFENGSADWVSVQLPYNRGEDWCLLRHAVYSTILDSYIYSGTAVTLVIDGGVVPQGYSGLVQSKYHGNGMLLSANCIWVEEVKDWVHKDYVDYARTSKYAECIDNLRRATDALRAAMDEEMVSREIEGGGYGRMGYFSPMRNLSAALTYMSDTLGEPAPVASRR